MQKNIDPLNEINLIKSSLLNKTLTYDQAKKEAEPFISMMNEKIKEVAKKHNKKPYKVSFSKLMR